MNPRRRKLNPNPVRAPFGDRPKIWYNGGMRRIFPPLIGLFLLFAQSDETTFQRLREQMVRRDIAGRGIVDPRVLAAMGKVPRHLFVAADLRPHAYDDTPLPIAEEQTISQPYIVALMTQVIAPAYGKKVLEIGTGSGYQAAILAEVVRDVYTIEINPRLAATARQRLDGLGYSRIHYRTGDGYLGWPAAAPFDGIIVTCSPDHIPQPLLDQLAVGGRMVIPLSYDSKVQELILIEKEKGGKLKKTNLIPVQFVPLIRGNHEQ